MVTQLTAELIEHRYYNHILHAESLSMRLARIYAGLDDSRKLERTLCGQKDRKNDIWS